MSSGGKGLHFYQISDSFWPSKKTAVESYVVCTGMVKNLKCHTNQTLTYKRVSFQCDFIFRDATVGGSTNPTSASQPLFTSQSRVLLGASAQGSQMEQNSNCAVETYVVCTGMVKNLKCHTNQTLTYTRVSFESDFIFRDATVGGSTILRLRVSQGLQLNIVNHKKIRHTKGMPNQSNDGFLESMVHSQRA